MKDLRIYSISDRYISYLRSDKRLCNVMDNKENARTHTRKYLGVVLYHGEFSYFVPFSSPKETDYTFDKDGTRIIRKSIIPIIRMVTNDTISGKPELKGTLKLSNMIPVPESELIEYDLAKEQDTNYGQLVQKELGFIRSNISLIVRNARVLYNQKTKCDVLYAEKQAPGYLSETVDWAA